MAYGNWPVQVRSVGTEYRLTTGSPTVTSFMDLDTTIYHGRAGSVTPGYAELRKKIKGGLLPKIVPLKPLAFQFEWQYTEHWFGFDYDVNNAPPPLRNIRKLDGYIQSRATVRAGTPTSPIVTWSDLESQARLKLRLKVKADSYNLAEMIATRRETADLVANTAVTLAKTYSSLRRGNLYEAALHLGISKPSRSEYKNFRAKGRRSDNYKNAADKFLQWEYGWAPLLGDIYKAMEESLAPVVDPMTTTRAVAFQDNNGNYFKVGLYNTYGQSEWTAKRIVKIVCTYSVKDFNSGKTLSQLGLTNPALLAWELVPFSFVIDWFLPVGNAISSWDATINCDFIAGSTTTHTVWSIKSRESGYFQVSPTRTISRDIKYSKDYARTDRKVNSYFPGLSLPEFKNPLSVKHAADAIALLVAVFDPTKSISPESISKRYPYKVMRWDSNGNPLSKR